MKLLIFATLSLGTLNLSPLNLGPLDLGPLDLGTGEIYTSYPAFGDLTFESDRDKRVELVRDKGVIRELTVRCDAMSEGTVLHDTTENLYCDARHVCHASLRKAISATCAPK